MTDMTRENMERPEAIARYLLGIVLIVAVYQPGVTPLLALAAPYPVLTAMMKWDPVYALYALIKPKKAAQAIPATPSHQATA